LLSCSYEALKSQGLKEERLLLLEAWRDTEAAALASADADNSNAASSREDLDAVEAKFPRKIKMRRPVLAEDGVTELGSEEYFDYVFPDDEKKMGTLSVCCFARWRL
jgi:crooked neck